LAAPVEFLAGTYEHATDRAGDEPVPLPAAGRVVLVYTSLWILEGAMRKWGPGGADTALYFLRDAVMALATIAFSIRVRPIRRMPVWIPAGQTFFIGVVLLQLIVSTLALQVALVGLQQYVSPLLFVHFCVRYVSFSQMERVCSLLIAFMPIECAISLLQVLSPATSWINAVGKDEYTKFFTADGVVRASGTFTAAYGLVCYLMLVMAIALARQGTDNARRYGAKIALPLALLTAFISGSRTAILFVILAIVAQAFMAMHRKGARKALVRALAAILLGGALALWAAPSVLAAFQNRSADAERTQSTSDRFKMQLFRFTSQGDQITFFGDGLGSHSAGGIAAGSRKDWIEDELGRWMREAGYLGVVAVLIRQLSVPVILYKGFWVSRKTGSTQCFLNCCMLAPSLAGGLINTQPSQQGFAALIGALIIVETYAGGESFDAKASDPDIECEARLTSN
jgi:hypothetical protein